MNPQKRNEMLAESRRAAMSGDTANAERICEQLLLSNPSDVQVLHTLAVIASARGDDTVARRHLQRCTAVEPRTAQWHGDLARVHALAGRYDDALACLQRALALAPTNRRTITDLADVFERGGRQQEAWERLQPLVDAGEVDEDMAPVAMRLLDHAGDTPRAIALARAVLEQPSGNDRAQRFLLQQLGRLLEKSGDAAGAFAAFAQAQRTERHRFDPDAHVRQIDALIDAFSPEALARLPRAPNRSETPVFIACMPRSGSTLVEQVIHAHPRAHGAGEHRALQAVASRLQATLGSRLPYPQCLGELSQPVVDRLSAQALRELTELAPRALRITNKHLVNYAHLGLVSLLFPGARVIDLRRDPMDNGLACFMTSLSPEVMPWATDLRHIGVALRQHDRLMAHWRRGLDLRWLDVRYEQLVEDGDAQIRRIVEFCGLPWDERCLRFWQAERVVLTPSYDQVRRPIYRSAVGRWRRYEACLEPLRQTLG
jgi:Flp pilus assembly protein TadD